MAASPAATAPCPAGIVTAEYRYTAARAPHRTFITAVVMRSDDACRASAPELGTL